MLAAPRAADRSGSSAQVSYVRPHRLSRERSCTGAKSHTQPVRPQRVPGSGTAGFSSRRIPRSAHADRLRVERRLPRMAEAVHRINAENHRKVQPRVLDRVLLDHVVYSLAQS